jgi:DNA modification methylase
VIHHGDCLEVMAGMEPASVDAVVTDPPYMLQFMGKTWDSPTVMSGHNDPSQPEGHGGKAHDHGFAGHWRPNIMQAWHQQWAEAAYRVAKPSAYLLAFGGTRTVHRMTVALEDAGWIIRDMLVWAYASGFPKSKASLKPAWEPIVMARKPGPLRELAIDACRIPAPDADLEAVQRQTDPSTFQGRGGNVQPMYSPAGRWPANVLLTSPIFDGGIEGVVGGGETSSGAAGPIAVQSETDWFGGGRLSPENQYGDSGTYSRFFLIPKADRADREPVLGGLPLRDDLRGSGVMQYHCAKCGKQMVNVPGAACKCDEPEIVRGVSQKPRANVHPTVKPTDLMRHLVRLVTPTGGAVLDPFLGSGSTALAAEMEGFPWIGIEREAEYVAIAKARLNGTQRGLGLEVDAPTPRVPNTHPDLSKHQPKQRAPGENWSGNWAGTPPAEETA